MALWQELGMKRQEAIEHLGVAQWHVEEERKEQNLLYIMLNIIPYTI